MTTFHLKGHVTEDGELVFDAPKDLPPGDVEIMIKVPSEAAEEIDLEEDFRQAWADAREGRTMSWEEFERRMRADAD